jgi:hypothetical protein
MDQTSIIFAALALAFIVYITLNGDLSKWLSIFGI